MAKIRNLTSILDGFFLFKIIMVGYSVENRFYNFGVTLVGSREKIAETGLQILKM